MAQANRQPLEPQRLAQSVKNEEEALELYFLSCAAIDIDHFMERSYLNALGDALKIPQDVRDGIEKDIQEQNGRYRLTATVAPCFACIMRGFCQPYRV